jgi:hypothetical protein
MNCLTKTSFSPTYFTRHDNVLCRDVIKDDFGGKLPSGSPFRPDVRARPVYSADAVLPADGFLPSADAVKSVSK